MQTTTQEITLDIQAMTDQITIGDWILLNDQQQCVRCLTRSSEFSRKAADSQESKQLIASNIDTVFIVSALNDDFNLKRLERFLALAHDAGVEPVIVLTKADLCADPYDYIDKIHHINSLLMVEAINALDPSGLQRLLPWCKNGQTIAFLGSSGVGKSTLINSLLGDVTQSSESIQEDDAKAGSLHLMPSGALLLTTPAMHELQLFACDEGINETFSDISDLAKNCKFSDCQHQNEPHCAVQHALETGLIEQQRVSHYLALMKEQARSGATIAEQRALDKSLQKNITRTQKQSKSIKRDCE